ncbi:MAG: hypothetical protein RIT45_3313 [Pseudomonadota bacterium]|jgi:Xaa-Pro aminopeptidase
MIGAAGALDAAEFRRRRRAISDAVGRPVVLLGHRDVPRNLPGYGYPFRQSSDFLYLTGCSEPGAAAILDDGALTLYLPTPGPGDALWHGETPDLQTRAAASHADAVYDIEALEAQVMAHLGNGSIATVASADARGNETLAWWSGRPLAFGSEPGDADLVEALCALRRRKSATEVAAMRHAAAISTEAHLAVAGATAAGVSERSLAALLEAVFARHGAEPGYGSILTRRGEILHCHDHRGVLRDGDLLLVDAGAELGPDHGNVAGYGADLTRTWPVSGRFDARQRAVYEVVLAAWQAALDRCRVGVRYREVHDAAAAVIARFLIDEGVLRAGVDEAVDRGLHGLFFPHGVGHLIGLDVHDLEAYGDRGAYPPDRGRAEIFGTRFLRLDLPLESGFVVTVEPGFYAVPAILADPELRERFGAAVDWTRAESYLGFGGIRIEDDVLVTDAGPDVLSAGLPRDVDGVEAAVGATVDLAGALGLR